MRLSARIAVGIGCASLVQVSSFAFAPLGANSAAGCTSCVGRSQQRGQATTASRSVSSSSSSHIARRGKLSSVAMSAAAADSEEEGGGEADGDTSSAVATKRKKKVNAELDDLVGEMASRSGDEPVIVPRGAGIEPMSTGPIKADPIPGMDDEDIPGKIVLSQEVLAEQQKGLEKIAQQLRRERLDKEAEEAIAFGFCPNAELWNGRSAMFGVTVGMLTEFWTGQSIPQQVETFAQVLGLLPLDYETYFK